MLKQLTISANLHPEVLECSYVTSDIPNAIHRVPMVVAR